MALSNKEIAEHFGFTPKRAATLIRLGMPVDNLENATRWRDARLLRGKRGGVEVRAPIRVDPSEIHADTDFDETVNKHRELKEAARLQYMTARDSGDPQSPKLYVTYQNILKTLVTVEREALARKLDAKEIIRTQYAIERFSKILSEIKSDLVGLGNELAPLANPDSPGTALKVIDDRIQKLLGKWTQSSINSIAEIGGTDELGAIVTSRGNNNLVDGWEEIGDDDDNEQTDKEAL